MKGIGRRLALGVTAALVVAMFSGTVVACDGDLSSWPSEIFYEPPAVAGEMGSIMLGPETWNGVALYADPAAISVSGLSIHVDAYWGEICGIGLIPPPRLSIIPVPSLAPGTYTIDFNIAGLPNPVFTRTLVVAGGVGHVAIPWSSPMAVGVMGLLTLLVGARAVRRRS